VITEKSRACAGAEFGGFRWQRRLNSKFPF
jgi:hypothetical protein